ncbi:unnamed protein product [Mytilus edulis]|uniref:Mab-21-like HhH/H2TH-like domain-containing protein n=1 Tax=Mytilus edulis TaxID=6550 RepID=A0A8S3S1A6_MYTED|nr:unnamed protein product [Mytilus edulis]
MKNLLFWISEEYGVKMFSKENLLFCLEICFERFKQHILKGSLPHYIIRDRNLLAGKLDTRTRQRIADEIDKILEDVFVTIFECRHIVLRSIKFLKMYNGSKRDFICQVKAPLNYCLMECPENVKLEIMLRSFKVCLSMVHLPNNSNKLLAFIEDMKSGNNCSRNILPCMLKTAKRFGSIQLGIMFHEERCRTEKTQTEIDIYLRHTHGLLKIGTDLDELSGKLYLVTFELLNNKIDTAWALLSLVMSNTKPFVYSGWCMEKNMVWVLKFLYSEILVVNYDMVHNELLISYDVMFPKNVVNFVPEPIKYELFLLQCTKQSNFCVYHPVVYAFYLNFEIKRKKNEQMSIQNEILRKLSSFIEDCNGGYERHRAYNILGYCYYVCGRINEAFTTFCLSMQEKCDSTNVAVYHLCIVLSEYFTNKDV